MLETGARLLREADRGWASQQPSIQQQQSTILDCACMQSKLNSGLFFRSRVSRDFTA